MNQYKIIKVGLTDILEQASQDVKALSEQADELIRCRKEVDKHFYKKLYEGGNYASKNN